MAITFDKLLGDKTDILLLRQKRAELISENIANADTPDFKAKDIDFSTALKQAQKSQSIQLEVTNKQHLTLKGLMNENIGYRIPKQADTGDGNTVDTALERSLFTKNLIEYQVTLKRITGSFLGIKKALTDGES